MWFPLTWPPLGTWPITKTHALTGNRTSYPLVWNQCSIHWATPARARCRTFLWAWDPSCCPLGVTLIYCPCSPCPWPLVATNRSFPQLPHHKMLHKWTYKVFTSRDSFFKSRTFWKFIQLFHVKSLFLLIGIACMDITQFNYSLLEALLSCSKFWAIINIIAKNICVHISVWT